MMEQCAKSTPEEIADFEAKFNVRLPAEMRTYYETIGGTHMGSESEAFVSFWPLWKVLPVPYALSGRVGTPDYSGIEHVLPEANKYFVFMDHFIETFVYAIRLSADPSAACPVVQICNGQSWRQKADSFGEVLRIFREDAWNLL